MGYKKKKRFIKMKDGTMRYRMSDEIKRKLRLRLKKITNIYPHFDQSFFKDMLLKETLSQSQYASVVKFISKSPKENGHKIKVIRR